MSAGFDMSRAVRSWLREDEHDNADGVLEVVLSRLETTPQVRRWPAWPARRSARLSVGIRILALATAVVVAVVGYALLPGVNLGPGATPSPSPFLIARGSVVEHDSGRVDFEATRTGSVVTGRMTIAARDGRAPITIDLQCARDGDDGILMIGGYVTTGNDIVDTGDPAWIVLQRGTSWARVGGASASEAREDCLANLDWWLGRNGGDYRPMPAGSGTVEFGLALPAPTQIARGRHLDGMLAWSRSVSPNSTWGPHSLLGDQGTIEFGA